MNDFASCGFEEWINQMKWISQKMKMIEGRTIRATSVNFSLNWFFFVKGQVQKVTTTNNFAIYNFANLVSLDNFVCCYTWRHNLWDSRFRQFGIQKKDAEQTAVLTAALFIFRSHAVRTYSRIAPSLCFLTIIELME